jgi:hypothetical protein
MRTVGMLLVGPALAAVATWLLGAGAWFAVDEGPGGQDAGAVAAPAD